MLLPHEIVATFLSTGETFRMIGDTVAQQRNTCLHLCMLPVSIWSHWLVWQKHHIEDLALFWEKEKNTRWFQNHPVLSETRFKIESMHVQSISLSYLIAVNLEQIRIHAATSRKLYLWDCMEMAPKASDLCLHFFIWFAQMKTCQPWNCRN